jgi:peptidyl-prolyl cis-trans isomerase D
MLSFFRRLSKSRIGTWIMAAVLLAILAGFAMADLSNFGTGSTGFGSDASTLARIGDQKVTDREMREAMQRRLTQVREQNPNADYASIAADFDPLLAQMIDQRAILAFAEKYGFRISKRLIDAEIASLPGVRGLNGQPSVAGYQQFLSENRLTDQQVRQLLAAQIVARYLLLPISAEPRVPVGVATPYASMLLEAREGEAAIIPYTAFTAGLKPSDADLQRYYTANRNRYMVPEQRAVRFAKIGPEQVAAVAASDQEIAASYKANQAAYAAKETRTLSQVVVPDQAIANGIAARAKGGGTLAAAAAPAGSNAAVSSLADQTQAGYAAVAGNRAAAAVFAAPAGAVIGPVQSEFGWIVAKVESVKRQGGKSLEAARGEIAAKLTASKRKQAIEDLVTRVQEALDDGANFAEAAGQAKLPVTTTPLLFANGTSRAAPGYRLPADLAPALKAGFEIAPTDQPEIAGLPDKSGYVMISPAQVVRAAPAPFAAIRERVMNDWITGQALVKARAAAAQIAASGSNGMSLAEAVKRSGVALPVRPLAARRIQIAQADAQAVPALRTLFTLAAGKSRMVPDAANRGFYVVKVTKIVPGNTILQPGLIGQMRQELQGATADEYAREFVAAARRDMKVRRNESAIRTLKQQIVAGGS